MFLTKTMMNFWI